MQPLNLPSPVSLYRDFRRALISEKTRPVMSVSAKRSNPMVISPTAISAVELKPNAVKAKAWDRFAERCGGSTRSTHGHVMGWAAKNILSYRLRFFEIFIGDATERQKIGQCALGESRRGAKFIFLDRLQLLPTSETLWDRTVAAVLSATGAGTYSYGWVLNIEPVREPQLAAIPGVKVRESRPLVVQAVDFSQWSSWDAYYAAISENNKRNAKAAQKNFADLEIKIRTGVDALRGVPALLHLRDRLSERKGLDIGESSAAAVAYVATILSCSRHMLTAVVRGGGADLSCFYGSEFGQNTYYLEGASAGNNRGAAWHLLIAMLRRAYERAPTGKFVMGYIDYSTHSDEKSAGLLRSRQSCRVSDYATSMVAFTYDPA